MGPPGGGPEDKTPPEIVSTDPPAGSVNVAPDQKIEIVFSEPVEPLSVERSIILTPEPLHKPKVSVHGPKVTIRLADLILAGEVLIVSTGTGIKDYRGNALKQSFTFAMTTGASIPHGRVTGRVYAREPLKTFLVGVWPASDSTLVAPDSILPKRTTQTSGDGAFAIDYLPSGDYRVACWEDKNGDRKYQRGVDRLGLPSGDLYLPADSSARIEIYATLRDTLAAGIALVTAPDRDHVRVTLYRPAGRDLKRLFNGITVSDTAGTRLGKQAWWADPNDSTQLIFLTDRQDSSMIYRLRLAGDTTAFSFAGAMAADTTRPRVAASIPTNGDRNLDPTPSGEIDFDDALGAAPLADVVNLTTNDSVRIAAEVVFGGANVITWKAKQALKAGSECKLSVDLKRLEDRAANTGADSVWSIAFSVTDPGETGSMSGRVIGLEHGLGVVGVRPLTGTTGLERFATASDSGGFLVEKVPPGKYVVWGWEDRDGDGAYSAGRLAPFGFAERFGFCPDTVTVRARWESEGVEVRINH